MSNFTSFAEQVAGAWSDDGDYVVGYGASGAAEFRQTKGHLAATVAHAMKTVPSPLLRWRKAMSKVQGGLANARILCMGDSTTFGTGSTGAMTGSDDLKAYPTQLAVQLTAALGCPATSDSWFGIGTTPGEGCRLQNDSRIVSTAGVLNSYNSLGGYLPQFTDGTTSLKFTPKQSCDTFRVWYTLYPSTGSLSFQAGTGTAKIVNTAGTAGIASTTVTGPLGSALNVAFSSGAACFILGIEAWNSAVPAIQIANAGYFGALTQWITGQDVPAGPFSPMTEVPLIAPDLIILATGINDWYQGTTVANYSTYLTNFVNAVKGTSDVLLMSPIPSMASEMPLATQQTYVDAMKAVAVATGVVFFDHWRRTGSRETMPDLYYDDVHLTAGGYADMARGVAGLLKAA